ncbi:hypothetical protein [Archangium violaceum]|uniref:hypothetical protein n=1 Tax=Archangium violaceum TaxID=83451 RepID=UPI001269B7A0|nr:hypothetical protein [Archangium violaceum]
MPTKSTDPTKHVNYVLGMVLGQDDFTQEFSYLSERDRWLVRELLGYGTAWGLAVQCRKADKKEPPELEVMVAPGVAVSPSGQLIRVTPAQCASLHGWLAAHSEEVQKRIWKMEGSDTDNVAALRLYVVLGYRELETDKVPIPGEPCRSEDDVMAPSRLTDGFRLELRFDPPEQAEEQGIRELMRWLQLHLEPNPLAAGTTPATLDEFLGALRTQWGGKEQPAPPKKQVIPPGELEAYLRAAFRVWVTELRPEARPTSDEAKKVEDVVLLAGLDLPFILEGGQQGTWELATTDPEQVHLSEEQRPLLLSLRLLQEWLLRGLFIPVGAPPVAPQPQPKPAPPVYEVVAAGVVKGIDEPGREDTYGDLRALWTKDGEVVFTFEDYEDPQFRQSYIVKVLPKGCEAVMPPTVIFCGYMKQGFVVRVFEPNGKPMAAKKIEQLEFIIEVSTFPLGGMP